MNELEKARMEIDKEDKIIREAFIRRMAAVKEVIKFKKASSLPILDCVREKTIIDNALAKVEDPKLKAYYERLLTEMLAISRDYQRELLDE